MTKAAAMIPTLIQRPASSRDFENASDLIIYSSAKEDEPKQKREQSCQTGVN
jgi:hypothetical protein